MFSRGTLPAQRNRWIRGRLENLYTSSALTRDFGIHTRPLPRLKRFQDKAIESVTVSIGIIECQPYICALRWLVAGIADPYTPLRALNDRHYMEASRRIWQRPTSGLYAFDDRGLMLRDRSNFRGMTILVTSQRKAKNTPN